MKRILFVTFSFLMAFSHSIYAQDYLIKIKADSLSVGAVAVSPDNSHFATAGWDKTIKIWNISTGECTDTLLFHAGTVLSVTYSPNGKYLASCGWDKKVCLWDAASNKLITSFTDHSDRVNSVCFSPDSKLLASASDDNTIIIYDIASSKILKKLTGHTDVVTSVCFTFNGKNIVSGSWDKTVKVWDIASGNIINTFNGHTANVNVVVASPVENVIASAGDDNSIKIWSIPQNGLLKNIQKDSTALNALSFSPDGKILASAGNGKLIKLWNVSSGELINFMKSNPLGVKTLCFNADGSLLLSAEADGNVKVWDMTYYKYEKCIKEKLKTYAYLIKPKDEFETTDQYDKRIEEFVKVKAGLKEECIKDEANKVKELTSQSYQLVDLKISFLSPYNADASQYQISIEKVNYSLIMPVEDAKAFKINYINAKVNGIKRYNPDSGLYEYINIKIINPSTNTEFKVGTQIDPEEDEGLKAFYFKNKLK